MQFTTALVALMATVASAAPTPTLTARQPGVTWGAVGNLYSGGGCTDSTLIFGDPVWGDSNVCHPVDRFGDLPPIVSYKPTEVNAGCTLKLYYDSACSVPAPGFTGIVGQCVQGNQPFVSAEVFCP